MTTIMTPPPIDSVILLNPTEGTTKFKPFLGSLSSCLDTNRLIVLVGIAVLAAFIYPSGVEYLNQEVTAGWIAIIVIYFITGLTLKTSQLLSAVKAARFNASVQFFNLCIFPVCVFGLSRLAKSSGLNPMLADGMVVCSALPMTISMVIVLTKTGGGDEAAAVFNSSFGNLIGVFITPMWLVFLLKSDSRISFGRVILDLVYRVVVPLFVGQVMQNSSNRVQALIRRFKSELKMLLEACLVFMVYCIFCNTFGDGTVASVGDVLVTAALQFFVLISAKIGAWYYMKLLFRDEPRLRVMGLFGCVHKTVAAGVTLLQAVYGDDPSIGLLTLPLLLYHPSQLVVGSMIAPHLEKWVRSEELRLCLRELPRDHKETVISQIHAVDVEIRGPI